jgi:hypothetical protein
MGSSWHMGRSFRGHPREDECPCPKEPCGLVDLSRTDGGCEEHGFGKAKTMRQGHLSKDCPGGGGGE